MAKRRVKTTKTDQKLNDAAETKKFWQVVGISTVVLIVLIYLLLY